jgi:Recombination endonuclease VII
MDLPDKEQGDVEQIRLCGCGCGQPVPRAKRSDGGRGVRKGQQLFYVRNHQPRGQAMEVTCPHKDRKHRGHGLCGPCYTAKWIKEHPHANSGNEWLRRHPAQRRISYRRSSMKRLYGLTFEMFNTMLAAQNFKCANNGCDATFYGLRAETYRKVDGLGVDHDHRTGKVRALLCHRCNAALGHVNDNITKLRGLIDYLQQHADQPVTTDVATVTVTCDTWC